MLRSRIGSMPLLSAEFAVLILLCISFSCGEARPAIFSRSDVSSTERIVRLGSVQRKILQNQQTPNWTESKDAKVPNTDKWVDEGKWEAKADEKNGWIAQSKDDEKAPLQEKTADRENVTVGTKTEAWQQGPKSEKEQSKAEEKNDEWHQKLEGDSKQIRVEKKASDPESKEDIQQTRSVNVEGLPEAQAKETNVNEKKGKFEPEEETKITREVVGKAEPNADEESENKRKGDKWEEKPVTRFNDEGLKVANEEEKKAELWKQRLLDEKKEPEDSQVDETKEEPKLEREERLEVTESKEFEVEDRKEEPKIDTIKEAHKMEQKSSEPIVDVKKEAKIGENDERKVETNQVGNKVPEDAVKVHDKKEEESKVALKNDDKDKDGMSSISSKVDEDKPVKNKIVADTHPDFDEDYPDFLDELRNFPENFQKTAESVKHHIRYSGLDKYSTHSKELFNQANQQIQESFTPLLGKDYAPLLAYLVSYGILLLPLAIVAYLLDRIRARFSLQKILLFVNIYLSAYFAALLAVALILESEPMKFFMQYSASSYIFLQLLQALAYLTYILLNSADLISTCSNGRIAAKFSSVLQWAVVMAVGFHYYVTVFHRAMIKKTPLTGWKIYGLYSMSFLFLCLFARIERSKKQYSSKEVDDTTDKKN